MATTSDVTAPQREPRRAHPREHTRLWGIPMTIGILLIIVGLFALSAAILTTFVSAIYLGVLLLVVGVLEIIGAFRSRRTGGRFLVYLLGGVLSLVVGGLFLYWPAASVASLTILIAGFLFASGLFRGITSIADRYPRWGWDLAYGIVAIVLGLYILGQFPLSALWVLGTIVGVEIIARGIALVAAAWMLRDVQHHQALPGGLAPA